MILCRFKTMKLMEESENILHWNFIMKSTIAVVFRRVNMYMLMSSVQEICSIFFNQLNTKLFEKHAFCFCSYSTVLLQCTYSIHRTEPNVILDLKIESKRVPLKTNVNKYCYSPSILWVIPFSRFKQTISMHACFLELIARILIAIEPQ